MKCDMLMLRLVFDWRRIQELKGKVGTLAEGYELWESYIYHTRNYNR